MAYDPFFRSVQIAGLLLTVGLGLLLTALRFRIRPALSTRSQRWSLSILAWLFLLNGFVYAQQIDVIGETVVPRPVTDLVLAVVPFLILGVGVTFPRPRAGGRGLRMIALGLWAASGAVLAGLLWTHAASRGGVMPSWGGLAMNTVLVTLAHMIGWFGAAAIWLPEYEAEPSPPTRLVLALLWWGFFSYPYVQGILTLVSTVRYASGVHPLWIILAVLIVLIAVRLTLALLRRRKAWKAAERLHAVFLVGLVAVPLMVVLGPGVWGSGSPWPYWTIEAAWWVVVRPLLFSAAVLMFQPSAPDHPLSARLAALGTLLAVLVLGGVTMSLLGRISILSTAAGLVVGAAAAVPIFRGLDRAIPRLLPASRAMGELDRPSARAVYQLTLQTAVLDGRVADPEDAGALANLRARLGVSDREHALLLAELAARDLGSRQTIRFRRLFFIHADGRLLCHLEGAAAAGSDPDILAGMLTAIRGYVTGGSGTRELETMTFGDEVLAIETRGRLVLAGGIATGATTEARQLLADVLEGLEERYGHVLERWDGDLRHVEAAKRDLERLLRANAPVVPPALRS